MNEQIEEIKRIAKEKGISQHEIARVTGIAYPKINAIFCERNRNPTIKTLLIICDCIGADIKIVG